VKEISNLILSPEEYFIFLRKFLHLKNIESLDQEYFQNPEILNALSDNGKYMRNSKTGFSIFNDLKDSKKIYHKIQKIKDPLFSSSRFDLYLSAYICYMTTYSAGEVILKQSNESQRELFTFFSGPLDNK
jgi:hypothetical protein